jgi:hypothetical protein
MKKKSKNIIIAGVIIIIIVVVFLLIIKIIADNMLNPFKTEEQKKLQPFYEKITEGTNELELKSIRINDDCLSLTMYISGGRSDLFTDADITSFNQVIEQAILYLNDQKHEKIPCSTVRISLRRNHGQSPLGVSCTLLKYNDEFYFDKFRDNYSVKISQFYLFKNVKQYTMNIFNRKLLKI